MGDYSMFMV